MSKFVEGVEEEGELMETRPSPHENALYAPVKVVHPISITITDTVQRHQY